MKSPLKDSVTNFKGLGEIQQLIPAGAVIDSYLLFGGSLELQLASTDRFVVAHTDKFVVYEFWKSILDEPWRVAEIVKRLYPIRDEREFYTLQEHWPKYKDPAARSALFFLLNRCSGEGLISSGKFSNKNFNPVALARLANFQPPTNFHLKFNATEDVVESIMRPTDAEYKLIPAGRFNYNLMEYGIHKGFETSTVYHRRLCEALRDDPHKWVLLYKDHRYVRRIFKDFRVTMLNQHGVVTTNRKDCEELIIANF